MTSPRRAVLGLLLLGACQNGVMMTAMPCELNSDCPAPLVCSDTMHCQAECVSQHDCIGGAHCAVSNGLGSCYEDQPRDHASSPCAPGRPCADASQLCLNYTCWNHCTTDADCVADSTCRSGACANPASAGSGYGVHVACTSAADCATGEICATDHGSQRACRRPCTQNGDCTDVEVTPLCAAIDDPTQPRGTMACVIGCDPVLQMGCLSRDRCEIDVAATPGGGTINVFECRASPSMAIQGAPCGTSMTGPMLDACGPYLGCSPTSVDMSTYQCRRFCLVDGDCMSPALHCTGLTLPMIANPDVVSASLHVCSP